MAFNYISFIASTNVWTQAQNRKIPTLGDLWRNLKGIVVVHKKCLTKYGGQPIKQILKLERILECFALSEPITWEKSQHNGIRSHLFYLNLQYCNVSLNFDKIQLTIVKQSQSINLISSDELKSSLY